jgi:hypothetical protein
VRIVYIFVIEHTRYIPQPAYKNIVAFHKITPSSQIKAKQTMATSHHILHEPSKDQVECALKMIHSLDMGKPKTLRIPRAAGEAGSVSAGTNVVIPTDFPPQAMSDVLNSLLLAQLNSTALFPNPSTQAVMWFDNLVKVLNNLGWVITGFAFNAVCSPPHPPLPPPRLFSFVPSSNRHFSVCSPHNLIHTLLGNRHRLLQDFRSESRLPEAFPHQR